MIGRIEEIAILKETLTRFSFVAFTGRRRVGKLYLFNQVYVSNICLSIYMLITAYKGKLTNHSSFL